MICFHALDCDTTSCKTNIVHTESSPSLAEALLINARPSARIKSSVNMDRAVSQPL